MESNHRRFAQWDGFQDRLSTIALLRPLWWPVLNLRHTVAATIRTTDDHRSRKEDLRPHFPHPRKPSHQPANPPTLRTLVVTLQRNIYS
uniref:Uncharacterized protein n=1 Tax=Salmonella sp. TaxID=599 RepID=A0A482EVG1_SALSP|nr:hypothetical protein NNIBIDOC_00061 [Salmonella sp.]